MKDIFPFDYQGGGYFRRKGVPVGSPPPILHGNEASSKEYRDSWK